MEALSDDAVTKAETAATRSEHRTPMFPEKIESSILLADSPSRCLHQTLVLGSLKALFAIR